MYNNPYYMGYNPQQTVDKINAQMAELERLKSQIQQPTQPAQPTNLTQNFQLAPTNRDVIKYASSLDEVQRDMVIGDTPFFSKDMSVVWIKNTKGDIKTYELNEIVPKDAKDMQIEYLQAQIEELKGKIENDTNASNVNAKQNATNTSTNDETVGKSVEKSEPSSISRVPKGKTK